MTALIQSLAADRARAHWADGARYGAWDRLATQPRAPMAADLAALRTLLGRAPTFREELAFDRAFAREVGALIASWCAS